MNVSGSLRGALQPGDVAPGFAGESSSLMTLAGQCVVIVFHAGEWNPATRMRLDLINRVLARLPEPVQALGFSQAGLWCNLDLGEGGDLGFPMLRESADGPISRLFGVEGQEAIYVIDPVGVVLWRHIGSIGGQAALEDLEETLSPKPQKRDGISRRDFLVTAVAASIALALLPGSAKANGLAPENRATQKASVHLNVNGQDHELSVDPNVTLLDALRERIGLTGTKKGCDHGQCGACTVHIDGRRVNSCLLLAVMQDGKKIETIEGLASGNQLHPVQEAFIAHDGFQCGYCTSGQIMSAVACIKEGHAGSEDEVKTWMSGNLCRCGAYVGIREAVLEAAQGGKS